MDRLGELEALLADLKAVTVATAHGSFTNLFQRGCILLELNDREAARLFETSQPTVNRWKHGKIVPGVPALVLRVLREEVWSRIRNIRKIGS
jgi:hypothetical protein